jgi:pyridoxal phosphate enzyme (YggS family)
LVAVSKTKPIEDILALYEFGQRDFGENYVQELVEKQQQLPDDIRWHFIGHLQTNKVKQVVDFVHLIHAVDSFKLLQEINKQAEKIRRNMDCLLQVHIAQEETKFGLNEQELNGLVDQISNAQFHNVAVCGLMGMASLRMTLDKVRQEFKFLKSLQDNLTKLQTSNFKPQTLSMGMTADYKIAIEEGSNMIRVGSLIFGERT